ncbi:MULTISPECIES: hypothetical protein [unclassified Flavobacterium]|uniref:hypothetical protein n=1 Tax=unclassified Flavobacterium TaxID=196869 RepID=UPI0012DE73FD|nr:MULTISPECIES: hypothetical protein [unclassified Flavobacterium]
MKALETYFKYQKGRRTSSYKKRLTPILLKLSMSCGLKSRNRELYLNWLPFVTKK